MKFSLCPLLMGWPEAPKFKITIGWKRGCWQIWDAIGYQPFFFVKYASSCQRDGGYFFKNNVILDRSTIYYWRVRAINNCKSGEWSEIFAFNTEVSSCFIAPSGPLTINISASGIVSVEGSLFVPQDNVITDLNVKSEGNAWKSQWCWGYFDITCKYWIVALVKKMRDSSGHQCGSWRRITGVF